MLVSRRKAEKILGLSLSEINKKIKAGEIKATKVGNRYQVEVPDSVTKPAPEETQESKIDNSEIVELE